MAQRWDMDGYFIDTRTWWMWKY